MRCDEVRVVDAMGRFARRCSAVDERVVATMTPKAFVCE